MFKVLFFNTSGFWILFYIYYYYWSPVIGHKSYPNPQDQNMLSCYKNVVLNSLKCPKRENESKSSTKNLTEKTTCVSPV